VWSKVLLDANYRRHSQDGKSKAACCNKWLSRPQAEVLTANSHPLNPAGSPSGSFGFGPTQRTCHSGKSRWLAAGQASGIRSSVFDINYAARPNSLVPILLSILGASIKKVLDKRMWTEE